MAEKRGNPKHRGFGWIRDRLDRNDLWYGDLARLKHPRVLPAKVDLTPLQLPIEDQGQQGSCVGHAVTRAHENLAAIDKGLAQEFHFSRAFNYYEARLIEGNQDEDTGCQIRDAVQAAITKGNCHESTWPYYDDVFDEVPSPTAYAEAETYQITRAYKLRNTRLSELLTCLADGFPFVIGIAVYQSMESDAVAKTGIVPMPTYDDQLLGGHAMCAVGYDQQSKLFKVANSWSEDWGDQGYAYLPFSYLTDSELADDFWTLRKGEQV